MFANEVIAITTRIDFVEQIDNLIKTVTKSAFTSFPNSPRKLILPSRDMPELIPFITLG